MFVHKKLVLAVEIPRTSLAGRLSISISSPEFKFSSKLVLGATTKKEVMFLKMLLISMDFVMDGI